MELKYIKDTDGREIDFVISKNKKPIFAVEYKAGERAVSSAIYYFKERLSIPYIYQVHLGLKHFSPEKGIEVIPFIEFCKKLNLPLGLFQGTSIKALDNRWMLVKSIL
jgi:predicted AAA+ superfamily ATPase